jgi:hypothetical protein
MVDSRPVYDLKGDIRHPTLSDLTHSFVVNTLLCKFGLAIPMSTTAIQDIAP